MTFLPTAAQPSAVYRIDISSEQDAVACDEGRLRAAIERILRDAAIDEATLSVALVDDPTIAALHQQFMQIEGPTDVLSFVLEHERDAGRTRLEGEVVASGDTAARVAAELGWPAADELLLYVIHGCLHLVGYDDLEDAPRAEMRAAELRYLAACGLEPPGEHAPGAFTAGPAASHDSCTGGGEGS